MCMHSLPLVQLLAFTSGSRLMSRSWLRCTGRGGVFRQQQVRPLALLHCLLPCMAGGSIGSLSLAGCRIASCGGDRQLFLWDVGTGKIIRKFKGHEGAINAVRPMPATLLPCPHGKQGCDMMCSNRPCQPDLPAHHSIATTYSRLELLSAPPRL